MIKNKTSAAFDTMIPILTTPAGCSLTAANWSEAGISTVSFALASLLMKPGYDFLSTLTNLAAYVGWNRKLVLNASLPATGAEGHFALCSHYDGRRIYHSIEEIVRLISKLKPNIVLLPKGKWQKNKLYETLPEVIFPFFPLDDLPDPSIKRPYGIHIAYEIEMTLPMLQEQRSLHKEKPYYVAGDLSLALMEILVDQGIKFMESDKPAHDAYMGTVYCHEGDFSIQEQALSMQFSPIDEHCSCPTCSQKFTKAYLHHLFEHTPLLCQRLLVQHNIHYCQQKLKQGSK